MAVLAQEERQYAIKSFKSGAKDVMVASGVASKGLDFNDIQHVIIFSMPKEIEDYVHQIGRTGRSGKTGIATTFVNMNTPEQTLLDLKYLLMEAGQKYVSRLNVHVGLRLPQTVVAGSLPSCKPSRIHEQLKAGHSRDVQSVEVGSTFSLSSPSPRRCKSLILFLQVWATAFPTVQSSKILSGGRWPPTELRKTLAGTECLCLLSSCNLFYCIITLIVVALVMFMSRVAWGMDRSRDSIQLWDLDGSEFADKQSNDDRHAPMSR